MKRNLLLFLLLAMTAVHLCGCKSDSNTTSETTKHPDPEVEVQENKTDNEEEPALNIPDLETTIFSEIERDAKLNLSDFNLNQYGFRFGNNKYTLPFSYARISKKWKFTPEYYGLDENFRLQPGQKTSENLILTNDGVDYSMQVGFYNPYDVEISIEDAMIWSIRISIENADSKPYLILPGNLTWGSSIVDVTLAYSSPSTPFTHDLEKKQYSYVYTSEDYQQQYELTISEEHGITAFSMKRYL